MEEKNESDRVASCHEPSSPVNGPCIEYLQLEIQRLLMKNETLRFELLSVRRKVERIERTVFGAGSHNLQKQLPPHLPGGLRDLCCCESRGENRSAPQPASDNVIRFRKK